VKDFLPEEFTNRILLIKDGQVTEPADWIGEWKSSFVFDAEVVVDKIDIDTTRFSRTGVVTGSELNAVVAILAINEKDSKDIQLNQASLKFKIFDLLVWDGKKIMENSFNLRQKALNQIMERMRQVLPFRQSEVILFNRKTFYDKIVEDGGEGVVFKRKDSPYVATTSRRRDGWVKLKRSMREALGDDVDVFISGFVKSDGDKAWKDYIGAIKVSVFLRSGEEQVEHWIGSVSGLPLELRKKMTVYDEENKPMLNPDFEGKVLVIDGQSVSARNLRFAHCRVENWESAFRTDKTKYECILDKENLMKEVR